MPTVTPANTAAAQIIHAPSQLASPSLPKQTDTPESQKANPVSPQTTDAPKEESKALEADPLAPKFAALAREQKAIRAQQRALQQARAEIDAAKVEIEQAKSWKSKLSQDPWSVLLEAGLSPEKATEIILNQPKPEDVKFTQLQKQIEETKAAHEQLLQQQSLEQSQRYDQAKKQILNDVKLIVDADPAFETVKARNAQEAVVELIEQNFNKTGMIMPNEEAAGLVEEYLLDDAVKFAQLKKVQARLAPPASTQTQQQAQKTQSNQKSSIQTLTNRTVQSSAKPLTAKDRVNRAILRAQGIDPDAVQN